MKIINTLLALALLPLPLFAQSTVEVNNPLDESYVESRIDSLNSAIDIKIKSIQTDVRQLQSSESELQSKNIQLQKEVEQSQISIARLKDSLSVYRELIDSNSELVQNNTTSIKTNQAELQSAISEANTAITTGDLALNKNIGSRSIIGIIALCLSVILSVVLALMLYRRSKTDISKLKEQAESLNKKIVEKLTSEATEISKITSAISNTKPDVDHSLIKTIADRITFMEMTLYKMDSSIRGHKQLSKSIKQMKDNLMANGYELVDMLGKPYHEGMNVLPNFTDDDTIEEGKQIITGIVKSQINYNGVMIQSAQITVSQNLK